MPKDAAPEILPELGIDTLFSVKGKIGLVTGGATGLGKSKSTGNGCGVSLTTQSDNILHPIVPVMAAAYVRNGAKRIYIASRKIDDLKKVAEQLNKLSPNGGKLGRNVRI